MTKHTSPIKSFFKKVTRSQGMGARRTIIEEMFNDFYDDRRNIYLMNFIRGIFFGLGSALGGTLVIAIIVWGLTFFVDLPGIGDSAEKVQDSLQTEQQK